MNSQFERGTAVDNLLAWKMFYSFSFLLAVSSIHCVSCLTCLDCTGIQSPRHCNFVKECKPGEVCNVHKTTNQYGDAVFEVGCAQPSVCSNSSHDHLVCDECCHTNLCNAAGCNMAGYPSIRGPVCYSCPAQTTYGTCHRIDVCKSNELCVINERNEFGDKVSTTGCVSLTHCNSRPIDISQIIGRSISDDTRSLAETTCHKCCQGDLCNAHCDTDCCSSNTCVCDQSHTGQSHSGVDFCKPDPCVYGTCISTLTHYTCVCDQYHTGLNCSVPKSHGTDCLDLRNVISVSGVYAVKPERMNEVIEVYCDMTTDGGGWAVFQHRVNGAVDFYQNFSTYENGFGDVHEECLKYIQAMVSHTDTTLRIDLRAFDGSTAYEIFTNFLLSPGPYYTLHVDHGNGTAGDDPGLSSHNGHRFSTFDNDTTGACVYDYHGGWWYHFCADSNLNGRYFTTESSSDGIFYRSFKGRQSLRETKMMFRRASHL